MSTMRWLSHSEQELPASTEWLGPYEAARAAMIRFTKRRNDFLLARWTAKRALALALGLPDDPRSLHLLEVRNATDGAPEAFLKGEPAPLAISMTDRAGWAVCCLHPYGVAVGCDLELVEPRSEFFVTDYLTPSEQRLARSVPPGEERDLLANLFWCAKESALKVLRTGLRRDTRSVEVHLRQPTDARSKGWSANGSWIPLEIQAQEGPVFPGWWRQYGQFLLTMAASVPTSAPVAMIEPPALETAFPTHTWMDQIT